MQTNCSPKPPQILYVGEELTRCTSCGTRTVLIAAHEEVRREACPKCGQLFDVMDDDDS